MQKITLLAVGKLKRDQQYLQMGIDTYIQRLRRFAEFKTIEVAEETVTATRPREQALAVEAARLLPHIEAHSGIVLALTERGVEMTSEKFSQCLSGAVPSNRGCAAPPGSPMLFVVGGAWGLSSEILHRADVQLSLSQLTFPHDLVRLILLEQLVRGFKILANEPYHK